jgi:hypothetical protein
LYLHLLVVWNLICDIGIWNQIIGLPPVAANLRVVMCVFLDMWDLYDLRLILVMCFFTMKINSGNITYLPKKSVKPIIWASISHNQLNHVTLVLKHHHRYTWYFRHSLPATCPPAVLNAVYQTPLLSFTSCLAPALLIQLQLKQTNRH